MDSLLTRRAHIGLLSCIALMVLHQAMRWSWYIEDSGICFAYARNLATGEGLVPFPGGERIEAYSDPSWVALLAMFYALGLDGFAVAKPLGMIFGAGTLYNVWWLVRQVLDRPGQPDRSQQALIAPLALAANAQFAIWSASGLENALFCFLLSAAMLRTVREIDAPDSHPRPLSALLYLLLALTRPEGVMYGCLGFVLLAMGNGLAGWRKTTRWLAILLVPLLLAEIARIVYFAWPWPNTFYAKIASRPSTLLDWDSRGWLQLRGWSDRLWHGYFAPVYVLGLASASGTRLRIGIGIVAAVAVCVWMPGDLPSVLGPLWTGALLLAGLSLSLLGVGTDGQTVRLLCGLSLFAGLCFTLVADGDWMLAFRFMSLVSAPLAVLFALGLRDVVSLLGARVEEALAVPRSDGTGPAYAITLGLGLGLLAPPNVRQTRDHMLHNQDVTLEAVRKRVNLVRGLARRSFYDGPISTLDIDQGAFLWWAPDLELHDLGKLIDIPMAHHWFQQRAFMREYLFEEEAPTFANVGGWWVGHTGLRRYPEWTRDYFETPGYQTIWGWRFEGLFARRDLVVADRVDGVVGRTSFDGALALAGFALLAPWVPGTYGYLEAPLEVLATSEKGRPNKLVAFLSRGNTVVASWDLPLGYGFFPQHWWRMGEVFRGKHAIAIPEALPAGIYDLGFVLFDADGEIVEATALPPEAASDGPVYARGEVRFPAAVQVVSVRTRDERIAEIREEISRLAASRDCAQAEAAFVSLLRHRPRDQRWEERQRPLVAGTLADCWASTASASERPQDLLARAHSWDHRSPVLAAEGAAVAARLLADGHRARAAGDWQDAYDAFRDVLSFQPWRAWARRYAEEARDERLGLTHDTIIGIGGEDDLRATEERH